MSPTDAELLERLREGKIIAVPTVGLSMYPFIKGGRDKVLVRKQDKVCVGDIVMAPYRGMMIMHRVYAIKGSQLILMGDGNLRGTEVVEKSEVCGTAIEIVKPNGHCRKPHKAWLWRHSLPFRGMMLKICRKWHRLWNRNTE
jgi:hypothetical protein